jgi:hypothetical protein
MGDRDHDPCPDHDEAPEWLTDTHHTKANLPSGLCLLIEHDFRRAPDPYRFEVFWLADKNPLATGWCATLARAKKRTVHYARLILTDDLKALEKLKP